MQNLSYFSKSQGTKGSIKNSPEDFIVEEISYNGEVLKLDKKIENLGEGDFTHFILQKKNWSTSHAIRVISKSLNTGQKRFGYAGSKDKIAITTQLCSAYRVEPNSLLNLKIKDIQINGAWKSKEPVKLGQLSGNKFAIKVADSKKNSEKVVAEISKELNGIFPNYFGEQRFGTTRKNTHKIGELLLRGRFKDAVLSYLCDHEGERNNDAVMVRKELKNNLDFKQALKNFPKYLSHERTLLNYLSQRPTDYVNSLRKLPRPILLLFVHAFQSYLFNLSLSERIVEEEIKKEGGEYLCGTSSYGFPDLDIKGREWLAVKIIGYESRLNKREKKLLEKFQIHQDDFKLKSLPEISSKGTFRTFFTPLKDFKFKKNTFRFSLPSGSYATSALREFLKN